MSNVLTEVVPISTADCFYIAERYKSEFTYPIHKHQEFELNFVSNCRGARRAVGDSLEVLGDYDLCLLGGCIEHEWQQYECKETNIHEITIQFADDMICGSLLEKNHMASIKKLLKDAEMGVAFDMSAIMNIYERIERLLTIDNGFYQVLLLFEILYELSMANYHQLASKSFSNTEASVESRRVKKVTEYIAQHLKDDIRLSDVADIAGMTPAAFSRFFKLRTHKTLSQYVVDARLGYAARKLADSTMTVLEICYTSGFNNVSYFNRIFKQRKGCTPSEFRASYHKKKIIV